MKHYFTLSVFTVGLLFTFYANSAHADIITFSAAGNISLVSGLDTEGLAGADFVFEAEFEDDAVAFSFPTISGFPVFEALSATLSIDNALNSASDGVFGNTGLVYYRAGQGDFGSPIGSVLLGNVGFNGTNLSLRTTVSVNGTAAGTVLNGTPTLVGDTISASSFGTANPSPILFFVIGDSEYGVSNFTTSVSTVPEPTGVAVLSIVLIGMTVRRKRV